MAKVKEGKIVQRFMSKGEIANYGATKAGKSAMVMSYCILLMLVALMIVGGYWRITWLGLGAVGAFFLYLVTWQARCMAKGKKLWKSIKDNNEPVVDLDKLYKK